EFRRVLFRSLCHSLKGAEERMEDIGHGPRFNIGVVGSYRNIREDTEYANVFPDSAFRHRIQYIRCAVIAEFAAIPTRGPFNKQERDPHDQKTNQIRD